MKKLLIILLMLPLISFGQFETKFIKFQANLDNNYLSLSYDSVITIKGDTVALIKMMFYEFEKANKTKILAEEVLSYLNINGTVSAKNRKAFNLAVEEYRKNKKAQSKSNNQ